MAAPLSSGAVAGHAVGGLVDRYPFQMIFGVAAVPVGLGGWIAWSLDATLGLGVAASGLTIVALVLPRLIRSRRLAREHAAQRARHQAELEAALNPTPSERGSAT